MADIYESNVSGVAVGIFDSPAHAIRAVISGAVHCGHVPKFLDDSKECERQAKAVEDNMKPRENSVGGGTLGPSLFENAQNPQAYFDDCARAGTIVENAIGKVMPASLRQVIRDFENLADYGYSVHPVVHHGQPAAYNRGLIFRSTSKEIVRIHEDLSNLKGLARFEFEIANASMVMAHNLYLRNTPSEGLLTMYGKRFTPEEKAQIDLDYAHLAPEERPAVQASGYYYPDELLDGVHSETVQVETGDYLVFRADFPHKVHNADGESSFSGQQRVSWNGFFTIRHDGIDEVLYWT